MAKLLTGYNGGEEDIGEAFSKEGLKTIKVGSIVKFFKDGQKTSYRVTRIDGQQVFAIKIQLASAQAVESHLGHHVEVVGSATEIGYCQDCGVTVDQMANLIGATKAEARIRGL